MKPWGEQALGGFSLGVVGALATFLLILIFVPLLSQAPRAPARKEHPPPRWRYPFG